MDLRAPSRATPNSHQRDRDKLSRIPIKVIPTETTLPKPDWIRIKLGGGQRVERVKRLLRERQLHSVCEEAACPNLAECFSHGTATFMILGDLCTRRCPFCDVAHGRPQAPDPHEPDHLADSIAELNLKHVVITSVDRDDLTDGGASHFASCIRAIRGVISTTIEILVPDFRGRQAEALSKFERDPADIFNHNLETVPRLYKAARPGADYRTSLQLLESHKDMHPNVPTKSGIMLGLGEELEEVVRVMQDLREHGCEMVTIGQYLQPSRDHLPVVRYVPPDEFEKLAEIAKNMGFTAVASAPLVRSSYQADRLAAELLRD